MILTSVLLAQLVSSPVRPIDTREAVLSRIHSLCPAIASMDRKKLLSEETRLTNQAPGGRTAPGRPYTGAGWFTLGCLRAKLSLVDPAPKANWGVIVPEPWANQALDALLSGLNLRPDHPFAAELFAAVAIDATEFPKRPPAQLYEDIALALSRAASSGARSPAVLRGCTSFMLAISDTSTARLCSKYALLQGNDSTWHLLRHAWIDARHADTASAVANLNLAMLTARDSLSRNELLATIGSANPTTASDVIKLLTSIAPDGVNLRACLREALDKTCLGDDVTFGQHSIKMFAGFSRLWHPLNGTPIGLVTYALARNDVISPDAMGNQTGAMSMAIAGNGASIPPLPTLAAPRMGMLFRQWDAGRTTLMSRGATIELTGSPYNSHGYATGFLFVSSQEAVRTWSLAASTPFGDLARRSTDGLTPLDQGPLAISDPVLGAARDDVKWKSGDYTVVLAPMNAVYRGEPAHLYFQVKSDSLREGMTTAIRFFRVSDKIPAAVLQVQINTPVKAGLNELQHEIDISRLSTGEYQLVVEAVDAKRGQQSRQMARITVK